MGPRYVCCVAVPDTALPPVGCPEVAPGGCVRDVRGAPEEPAGACDAEGGGKPAVGGSVPGEAPTAGVVERGLAVTISGTKPGGGCVKAVGRRGGPESGGQPVMLGLGTGDIAMNELRAAVSAPTCFFNASMSAAPAAALGSGATLGAALEAPGGWVAAVEAAGGRVAAVEAAGGRVEAATTVTASGGGVPGIFVRHYASRFVRYCGRNRMSWVHYLVG